MRVSTIASIVQQMASKGPLATIRAIRNRLVDKYLDSWLGIDTAQNPDSQELVGPHARPYVPSNYASFTALMKSAEIQRDRDVLVDFGAGKGRSVVFAAMYPFKGVVGVELSTELCKIAEQNIRRIHSRLRCKNVSIVKSDAATFPIPADMTVAYFFNPFTGGVLDAVLRNVQRSLVESPRRIRMVCNDYSSESEFAQQIGRVPWLVLHKRIPLGQEGQVGSIYVNV